MFGLFKKATPSWQPRKVDFEGAKRAVVRVGDGLGFVCGWHIVTDVKWLPREPIITANGGWEFEGLVGPRNQDCWPNSTSCLYAEMASETALLRDWPESRNRRTLTSWEGGIHVAPLEYPGPADSYPKRHRVWILSPLGEWTECVAQTSTGQLLTMSLDDIPFILEPSLSGSPIINEQCEAVGMLRVRLVDDEGESYFSPYHPFVPQWLQGPMQSART